MNTHEPSTGQWRVREATRRDLPAIIQLLADDTLGRMREAPANEPGLRYIAAFEAIDQDPNHHFLLVESADATPMQTLVACMQMSFIPGLSRGGRWRMQLESVRVATPWRGRGLGHALFEWAIDYGRQRGCTLVQLTSDKTRTRAHGFYSRLGFEASHEGYKRNLDITDAPLKARALPDVLMSSG